MNGLIDTLWLLREIDTAEDRLNKNRNNKLGDIRDLDSDEFKKYYKPSDKVLNYIDLSLKADGADNMNKRSELNSKLKTNILLLNVWKFLIDGGIM